MAKKLSRENLPDNFPHLSRTPTPVTVTPKSAPVVDTSPKTPSVTKTPVQRLHPEDGTGSPIRTG
ncbi:hypothetical protein KKC08_04050 [Patescibacteria group bacterium]|nr:hypothetical protein [Patescibacteria group bacterium]MBU4579050.1 hypothetical protein [Patescibacteria group bacterium]